MVTHFLLPGAKPIMAVRIVRHGALALGMAAIIVLGAAPAVIQAAGMASLTQRELHAPVKIKRSLASMRRQIESKGLILRPLGEPELHWPAGRPDVDGGSEIHVFRFEATDSGEAHLTFHQTRPGAKNRPPRKICGVEVLVLPSEP